MDSQDTLYGLPLELLEHRAHWQEEVVRRSRPLYRGDGKYLSQGRGDGGRWLQVIYVLDDDGTVFVIHARPMSEREKRHFRRRWR